MEIWYCTIGKEMDSNRLNFYLDQLPYHVKEEVLRYKVLPDMKCRLFSKILLQKVFESNYLIKNVFDKLISNYYGKPYIGYSDIFFNLSHSHEYIVLAVERNKEIGVDIEKIEKLNLKEYQDILSKKEWTEICSSMDPVRTFYDYWTKKECASKADGRGLSIPFKDIRIENNLSVIYNRKWILKEIKLDPDYILNIASESKSNLNIKQVEFN